MGKIHIEDKINAILDRDKGMPFTEVLDSYGINANQFHTYATRYLDDLIDNATLADRDTLLRIQNDKQRKKQLFEMGESFVCEQYDKLQSGQQKQFHSGTLQHPNNNKHIIYYALTQDNPDLKSTDRKKVIQTINKFPKNRLVYFKQLGLGGVMVALGKGKYDSPLAVIEIFNERYQEKTRDTSLFNLKEKTHLHKWADGFEAPNKYWENPENRKEAVYHTLTENHQELKSKQRKTVIENIKNLSRNLAIHFCDLGLSGLMDTFPGSRKGSPRGFEIVKIFDEAYQEKKKSKSIFYLNEKYHLHPWDVSLRVPNYFWQKWENVSEVVYHTLTEQHPELKSTNYEIVEKTIQNFPKALRKYFNSIGLSEVMRKGYMFSKIKKNTPKAVLEIFDKVYQQKTANK